MTEVLQFAAGCVIGLTIMFILELAYDYVSARFQRPAPYWEPTTPYTLEDIMAARDAMRESLFPAAVELERHYITGPEINEGDRLGVETMDGKVIVGIVTSHVETAPGVWSTTMQEERA
jgi:hypothetical protein